MKNLRNDLYLARATQVDDFVWEGSAFPSCLDSFDCLEGLVKVQGCLSLEIMKKNAALLSVLGVALFFLLVSGLYFFTLFDPFEWGGVHSSNFTWGKFASVKKGEHIEAVIARLGQPVCEPYAISVISRNPNDPCVAGGCKEYIFAGANWGASYKEAIVITDQMDRVIQAHARQE